MNNSIIEKHLNDVNQLADNYSDISNVIARFKLTITTMYLKKQSYISEEEIILYNKIHSILKNYNSNIVYGSLFKYISSPRKLLNELKEYQSL